jgi:prepilin-type N-terminal cleavage/methylation domain-containing protein
MRQSNPASAGFTLIEVLIAVAIFVTSAVGMAQLVSIATATLRSSREQTTAVILAAAKIDQLRSLAWAFDPAVPAELPIARTDITTNVSHPSFGTDGRGLQASPSGTLAANVPPYVDYLDESGSWIGNEAEPPAAAVFVRRWAVVPLESDPDRTLVLQVLVTFVTTTRLEAGRPSGAWRQRAGPEALLVSVRTRKGQ